MSRTIEIDGDADSLLLINKPTRLVARKLTEKGTHLFLAMLPRLPDSIREIEVLSCWHLFDWPDCKLPASLNTLTVVGSRMRAVPNLTQCHQLEAVDLHDNHIADIL